MQFETQGGIFLVAMANICSPIRSHAARTESFCSRRADRSEGSCNIVCSIETERSAQVWARWSSPFPTWRGGGTGRLVGTRNPRARINSCFARLSTIWPGKSTWFTTVCQPSTCRGREGGGGRRRITNVHETSRRCDIVARYYNISRRVRRAKDDTNCELIR